MPRQLSHGFGFPEGWRGTAVYALSAENSTPVGRLLARLQRPRQFHAKSLRMPFEVSGAVTMRVQLTPTLFWELVRLILQVRLR